LGCDYIGFKPSMQISEKRFRFIQNLTFFIFRDYKVSTKISLTQSIFPNLELEILNAKPHADLLSA